MVRTFSGKRCLRVGVVGVHAALLSWTGAARAAAVDFSVVTALGDSLTAPSPFLNYAELISIQLGTRLNNLAVGGSTSASLLAQGQHTRAVNEYHTTFAFLWIGGNDMRAAYGNGQLLTPGATGWIDAYAANFATALDTLLAGGAKVITANLMDYDDLTGFPEGQVVSPRSQPTVHANMLTYTARLQSIADARGVPVVNLFELWPAMLADPPVVYGHPLVNRVGTPYEGRLWMDLIHPNQLGHLVLANFFIDKMNAHWGLSIPSVPLPEPASLMLLALGVLSVSCGRWGRARGCSVGGVLRR